MKRNSDSINLELHKVHNLFSNGVLLQRPVSMAREAVQLLILAIQDLLYLVKYKYSSKEMCSLIFLYS